MWSSCYLVSCWTVGSCPESNPIKLDLLLQEVIIHSSVCDNRGTLMKQNRSGTQVIGSWSLHVWRLQNGRCLVSAPKTPVAFLGLRLTTKS